MCIAADDPVLRFFTTKHIISYLHEKEKLQKL